MHLLTAFSECLREGVLRHYFIPRFNLLSVKLTRAAQTELLQLFDIILQSDISVLRECRTFQNIWSEFLNVEGNKHMVLQDIKRRNMLKNDECMMKYITENDPSITYAIQLHDQYNVITSALLSLCCKTHLKTFVLIRYLFFIHVRSLIQCDFGNKDAYQSHQSLQTDTFSIDIHVSLRKLWYAILLLKRRDHSSVLNITNQILSSIPPFVIYENTDFSQMNNDSEAKRLYVDMFLDSDTTVIQRARKAWMFALCLTKDMADVVPLAIQIELYFSDPAFYIRISTLTCIYYLQFLCYHRMCQYDSRNRALQQLIALLTNKGRITDETYHTGNIAGHCLLLAGERAPAWELFHKSYQHTQRHPPYDKYNSAVWYLQNCF